MYPWTILTQRDHSRNDLSAKRLIYKGPAARYGRLLSYIITAEKSGGRNGRRQRHRIH